MGNSRGSYLIKNTFIFIIGNFATKSITFFLIPLYTNRLTTAEYGTIDLVVTIVTIAVPVFTLNVMEAVMRFNLDSNTNQNQITKVGLITFCWTAIASFTIIPICNVFDLLENMGILIYLYCVSSAAYQIFLCDLRGKELLVQYSIGNVLTAFLIAVNNILFLCIFNLGISGYLLAYIFAYTLVSIYAMLIGKSYKAVFEKIDFRIMKKMFQYSTVLIPNSFMWWIMNSSDHLMVTVMIGVASNGIYSISYKVPNIIIAFMGPFNQAWSYSAIKEEQSSDVEKYTNSVLKSMIGILMLVGLCMMTFIKFFLKIYVSNNYYLSWKYTPFLIIGCVYLLLATFMSTSYTVHKDSIGFLVSGTFGAVLNILLNYLLIPQIGVYGAAFSTCMSYVSVFVFRIFHTRKYMKYNVLTREFVLGTLSLIASATFMFFDNIIGQILQLLILVFFAKISHEVWIPIVKTLLYKLLRKK